MNEHTYAICAYKESPFLEDCIESVTNQTVKSEVFIATSTPNDHIRSLAEKYGLNVYVNTGKSGITEDWNFAYSKATTRYVTITHQDDVYLENYSEELLKTVHNYDKLLIYHTNYGEIRNGKAVDENKLLKIKRLMLFPMKKNTFSGSIFVRRRILSLGSPICCPSVTFDKKNIPEPPFKSGFRSNEDWEAWEMLSRKKGNFVYNHKILMRHRIHEESETTLIINDGVRTKEDYQMFRKFWCKPMAGFLTKLYAKSENSNSVNV